jgi:GTP-binding protein
MVEWFLSRDGELRGVVHLVDGRHPPSPLDMEMMEFLGELGLPALVVLTKMDRVKKAKRQKTVEVAAEALRLDPEQLLLFSSKTREGREVLLKAMEELLPPQEVP